MEMVKVSAINLGAITDLKQEELNIALSAFCFWLMR
jgi:hypothetical protein